MALPSCSEAVVMRSSALYRPAGSARLSVMLVIICPGSTCMEM